MHDHWFNEQTSGSSGSIILDRQVKSCAAMVMAMVCADECRQANGKESLLNVRQQHDAGTAAHDNANPETA